MDVDQDEEGCCKNTVTGLGLALGLGVGGNSHVLRPDGQTQTKQKTKKTKVEDKGLDLSFTLCPKRQDDEEEEEEEEEEDINVEHGRKCFKNDQDNKSSANNSNINVDRHHTTSPRKKLRLTKEQSTLLEDSFKHHPTLNPAHKQALAEQLNLKPRQVEVWFQNRRARTKLKQTEVDCEFLRKCCESLSDENRRLKKELQELRSSLKTGIRSFSSAYHHHHHHHPALALCPSCSCTTDQKRTSRSGTQDQETIAVLDVVRKS